jgi:hypothetical protein
MEFSWCYKEILKSASSGSKNKANKKPVLSMQQAERISCAYLFGVPGYDGAIWSAILKQYGRKLLWPR